MRKSDTSIGLPSRQPFTAIPNTLLEALSCCDLSAREIRILLTIIRCTIGWNRQAARIPRRRIAELTSISKNHVSTLVRKLVEQKILRETSEGLSVVLKMGVEGVPNLGLSTPVDGTITVPKAGVSTVDSALPEKLNNDPKERKESKETQCFVNFFENEDDAVAALAKGIAAVRGATFTERQLINHVRRFQRDLADLSLYTPQEIAKAIMQCEHLDSRIGHAWTPKHLANVIDGARGKPIRKQRARFEAILAHFPTS